MSSSFLDVRRMYRPMASPVERPAVLAERARLAEFAARDSAGPSSPATNVLTFVRPEVSQADGFMSPLREAMNLLQTTNDKANAARLEAAFVLLVERAASASFSSGPAACSAFVGAVLGELTLDDPNLDKLRAAMPEVQRAERDAAELLAIRCAVCTVGACPRATR